MEVDESRCDDQPRGVNYRPPVERPFSDGTNRAVQDAKVACGIEVGFRVDDTPVENHHIVVGAARGARDEQEQRPEQSRDERPTLPAVGSTLAWRFDFLSVLSDCGACMAIWLCGKRPIPRRAVEHVTVWCV